MKNVHYFLSIVLLFLALQLKSQAKVIELRNHLWTSPEGVELKFTADQLILLGQSKTVALSNSRILSHQIIHLNEETTDTITTVIGEYKIEADSLTINFVYKTYWKGREVPTINPPTNYRGQYNPPFFHKEVSFYNENTIAKKLGKYDLLSFEFPNLKLDSMGNILVRTGNYLNKLGDQYLKGIYRGKLSPEAFQKFKLALVEHAFFNKPNDRIQHTSHGSLAQFMASTSLIPFRANNYDGSLRKFTDFYMQHFYSDSSWQNNQMKYYGDSINNKIPLSQLIYRSNGKLPRRVPFAISAKPKFIDKIETRNEQKYLYQIIVDSLYTDYNKLYREKTLNPFDADDTAFFVSDYKLDESNSIGIIYSQESFYLPKLEDEDIPQWPLSRCTFNTIEDTFSLDSSSIIFDFIYFQSKQSILSHFFEIYSASSGYVSNIDFKVSKALRKLRGTYYY